MSMIYPKCILIFNLTIRGRTKLYSFVSFVKYINVMHMLSLYIERKPGLSMLYILFSLFP